MANWRLVPCLVRLRGELDRIAPKRDRTSDGALGDAAHRKIVSDHNDDEVGRVPIRDADRRHEVHAYDADADLRTPGLTMEMVVQHILARCRSGRERRLRYVIYNRRIWAASNGWRQRRYDGASPHTAHAHFSASYESKHEASTASWHLEDIPVALTDADKAWIAATITSTVRQLLVNDAAVQARMRAYPWQYVGGGIPAGMSTLKVLNETYHAATGAADAADPLASPFVQQRPGE